MKKTLTILTAAAMLLTGCSKKGDTPPDHEEPIGVTTSAKEHTADTNLPQTSPTEPIFRQLSGDSFTAIKVNIIRQDVNQQLEVLSDVTFTPDFGAKDMMPSAEFIERYEVENTYVRADITGIETDGETIYFRVSYHDAFRTEQSMGWEFHSDSIFKYRISDGETKELFNFSDQENISHFSGFRLLNNKLWIAVRVLDDIESEDTKYKLICIDTASDEIVKETLIDNSNFFDFFDDDPNRLVFHYWTDDYEKCTYNEYIPETDTIEEIAESAGNKMFFTDSGIVTDEVDDEGYCTVISEDFRLETGLKGKLAAIGGHNITITRANDDVIHIFNLEKMERYDIDLSGLGSDMKVTADGNDLIVSSSGLLYHYYLKPEFGACWLIQTSRNLSQLSNTGDAFVSYINDYRTETINIKKIGKPE